MTLRLAFGLGLGFGLRVRSGPKLVVGPTDPRIRVRSLVRVQMLPGCRRPMSDPLTSIDLCDLFFFLLFFAFF